MLKLFKLLLKGLLTVLLSPFFLVYLVIMFVYQLLHHLVYGCIAIVKFFMGKNIKKDDEETIKYKQIMESTPVFSPDTSMEQPVEVTVIETESEVNENE